MDASSIGRVIAVALAIGGCASIAGLDEEPASAARPNQPSPDVDGSVETRPIDVDGSTPLVQCTPPAADPASGGTARSTRAAAVAIDGLFDDWACARRVTVDPGAIVSSIPATSTFAFASQWDDDWLYLYAKGTTATPGLENTGPEIYRNDGFQFFIGSASRTAQQLVTANDLQFAFDHAGRQAVYAAGGETTSFTVDAKVVRQQVGSTLQIELEVRIPRSMIATSTLAAGQRFAFDAQLNDGVAGGARFGFRTWFRSSACGCTTGCCERAGDNHDIPSCDMLCAGTLALE